MKTSALRSLLATLAASIVLTAAAQPPAAGPLNEEKLPPRAKALARSARLGSEWLFQANEPDGRFRTGVNPVLNLPLPDNGFLPQAEATLALAQAARLFGDERCTVRAKQALLSLLAQTKTDPQNPALRFTSLPAATLNRAAAASLVVWAIAELPEPGKDLLEQSEQLASFLRTTQQPDGSFQLGEQPAMPNLKPDEAAQRHLAAHGWIVAALMRSTERQPAAWKVESVRKAFDFYRSRWQANKQPGPVPGLMVGFAEAYRQTKEKPYADAVLEMADWTLSLQCPADARQPLWEGGFFGWKDGKVDATAPTTAGACFVEALAAGMATARLAGDVARFERCKVGVEKGGQFLATHQYHASNVGHYADFHQRAIVGSFFVAADQGANPLCGTAAATRALCAALPALAEGK